MIRIVKKGEKLSEADILDRYVLQEQPWHWLAYGKPRIAAKVAGSRVYLERERPVLAEDGRTMVLTGQGEREADGYTALSAIKCVCDTAEEVNVVLKAEKEASQEFHDLIERARLRLAALDGTSVGSDAAPSAP